MVTQPSTKSKIVRPIALMTDFGSATPFVGAMKGVIMTINREARVIDLTHDISPYNVIQAAMALKSSYSYFPKGTIFMVVVDPTVGSERKKILVEAGGRFFVGPDNGVFGLVLEETPAENVTNVKNRKYFLKKISNTFHGRDIFAPVAAWLSLGTNVSEFGPQVESIAELSIPQATVSGDYMITGEILFNDRFGNLTTNITAEMVEKLAEAAGEDSVQISVKKERIASLTTHYAEGKGASALVNSWGYLEIYLPMGNALQELGIETGEPVWVSQR